MKSYFIMGDIHGEWGLANHSYDEMKGRLGAPDCLIQVGDFGYYPSDGINPHTGSPDPYHYKKESGLWEREFGHEACFIDGNHEDHEALRAATHESSTLTGIAGTEWTYMKRGVCHDGILYIGGASSVDKEYRLRWGHHWSRLENLTREEVMPILDANHPDVKVVISHTCPSQFDMSAACNPAWGGENKLEVNRVLLQEILEKYKPEYWFFGHWHRSILGTYGHPDGTITKWQCLNIGEIAYHEV